MTRPSQVKLDSWKRLIIHFGRDFIQIGRNYQTLGHHCQHHRATDCMEVVSNYHISGRQQQANRMSVLEKINNINYRQSEPGWRQEQDSRLQARQVQRSSASPGGRHCRTQQRKGELSTVELLVWGIIVWISGDCLKTSLKSCLEKLLTALRNC